MLITICIMIFDSRGQYQRGRVVEIPNWWDSRRDKFTTEVLRQRIIERIGHPPFGWYMVTSEGDGPLIDQLEGTERRIPAMLFKF